MDECKNEVVENIVSVMCQIPSVNQSMNIEMKHEFQVAGKVPATGFFLDVNMKKQ